jgi:pyridoxine/pyridoxamine 5'-phosphate oxidase
MELPSFDEMERDAWERLGAGSADSRQAFHCGVVATVNGEGGPEARTVVLREADRAGRRLCFHTDKRSPKAHQLVSGFGGGRVQMVFYSPADRIQVRLGGVGSVNTADALAEERWTGSKRSSQLCYATPVGSSQVVERPVAAPEGLAGPPPARENFAVVLVEVEWVEWLQLHHGGHRRARISYLPEGTRAVWLAP